MEGLDSFKSVYRSLKSSSSTFASPSLSPTMNLSPKPQRQPKSWAISLRCRSKGLEFRMNAVNILADWGTGGERFSFFLRLQRFFSLTLESEFREGTAIFHLEKKKGRLRRLWEKLFGRWGKGKRNEIRNNRRVHLLKEKKFGNFVRGENWSDYQTSLVPIIGSLSLLFYSSTQRDHKGILIHAFSYLFYLVSFCKITKDSQLSSVFIIILVCIAGLYFSYFNCGGFISKAAHLGSNWICLLALTYLVFSKLISSSSAISIERGRLKLCLLIITSLLAVLLYKIRKEIPLYLIKIVFYCSRAWISGLLLTTQALFQTLFESKGKKYTFGALLYSAYFWGKEIANYFVPLLQVYAPKIIFDMPTTRLF